MKKQNEITVESLDQEGRGVARQNGKVIFIEGALTGETVTYQTFKRRQSYEMAQVDQIGHESPMRVKPRCRNYGVCGGCSMQHMDAVTQVAVKQRILEDTLAHIGKVKPDVILPPVYGSSWGYRQRARISVRYVQRKDRTLIGFHERHSSFVTDMQHCEILTPRVASLLPDLAAAIDQLSIRDRLPQIEVASGDDIDVLVLRIMQPLADTDKQLLRDFADEHRIQFWLQPKGPDSIYPFHPLEAAQLSYSLPEFNVIIPFAPTEFTQVNGAINRVMVGRAVRLLEPQPGEHIGDFFCGLGNFSLPIARSGATVTGIEGNDALVERAQQNAAINGLSASTRFVAMNLFEMTPESYTSLEYFDKLLIDPPRDGAVALVKSLAGNHAPRRIVYVSCKPSTLARDAQILVHDQGYQLRAAGVMNMFPHTSHIESIAVFERP
ncbi:23S rRNA (uracil(1939)-C(5))-methyltransferase RlmD [Nitrosomonas marina]|uniref:23S rRNA (uracil(1939)-C(5))-methyltransferase RlmD n=1 Tax=Nitrosomonas marina TaxID=917 RepID=A0A1H8AKB3_9PROT|nr:23S rRNA (uracil(1939)-C(5))-methyltransferase RlmD [Nitrosomonas marina]SEM70936.1 23S rRNA m(5)U-1939 methyltransferase [Nitrosomonas marina]